MIKHIVLRRLKNKADVARVKQELESMRGKIPGLLSLEVGVNFAESSPVGCRAVQLSSRSGRAECIGRSPGARAGETNGRRSGGRTLGA